jgi:hypothetical protein
MIEKKDRTLRVFVGRQGHEKNKDAPDISDRWSFLIGTVVLQSVPWKLHDSGLDCFCHESKSFPSIIKLFLT